MEPVCLQYSKYIILIETYALTVCSNRVVNGGFNKATGQMDRKNIKKIFQRYNKQDISVDGLFYHYEELMEIWVDAVYPFILTGHFPILVGYTKLGGALYCARDSSQHFSLACVEAGSKYAVFQNDSGEKQSLEYFWVTVLRFDPCAITAHHASRIQGAMDPTGPLHWRRIWPSEDPSLQSLIEETQYSRLKKNIVPFLDECAKEAVRNVEGYAFLPAVLSDVGYESTESDKTSSFKDLEEDSDSGGGGNDIFSKDATSG